MVIYPPPYSSLLSYSLQTQKPMNPTNQVLQNVTKQIIEAILNDPGKFFNGIILNGKPFNLKTNHHYSGFNWLNLSLNAVNYEVNAWLSFKQAQSLGYSIKKGEKGTPIFIYIPKFKDSETNTIYNEDEAAKLPIETQLKLSLIPVLKYATVFNVGQLKQADEIIKKISKNNQKIQNIDEALASMNIPPIIEDFMEFGAYDPQNDTIKMPKLNQYVSSEDYYMTLFHEIIHSTGHPKRLNRNSLVNYLKDDKFKAYEELVAELGSAFLASQLNVNIQPHINNIAAYLRSWIAAIESDFRMLLKAANEAYKAVEFLTNHQKRNPELKKEEIIQC